MKTPTNSSTTKAQLNKVNRRILATSISALLGATLLGLAPTAKAQQFWDGAGVPADGQIDGGAGTWDNASTNWTNFTGTANAAYAPGTTARFLAPFAGGPGPFTVTLGANINLTDTTVEIVGGNYVFAGAGVNVFNIGGGFSFFVVTSPLSTTVNAQIINAGTLAVGNAGVTGTLILTNTANNYSGGTTLLGQTTLLNNAATSALGSGALTINGAGSTFGTSLAGAVTITNDVNVNANFNLRGTAAASLFLTNVNLGVATPTITGTTGNFFIINGTITGAPGTGVTFENTGGNNGGFEYGATERATYTGVTTVQNDAILVLSSLNNNAAIIGNVVINSTGGLGMTVANQIADTAAVSVNTGGLWALNSHNETIKSLNSGAAGGSVTLGSATLTVSDSVGGAGVFNGNISGIGGSLVKNGLATDVLTLGGVNSYSGATTINGGRIVAGSVSGLSSASAFNLTGVTSTLELGGFNNTILSLTGVAGSTVQNSTATPAVLTTSGAVSTAFAGNIINGAGGSLGLTKSGTSTLTLSGNNTYSGTTTITAGSQIMAGSVTGLSANSAFVVQASSLLDLNGFSNTIASLSDGVTAGGIVNNSGAANAVLTFGGDGTNTRFNGQLTNGGGAGNLGITKAGAGVTTLGGTTNNYTGPTTINGGTIRAGAANALSAVSDHTIGAAGTLDIGGLAQTIGSLAGAAGAIVTNNTLSPATLTTNGSGASTDFAGVIQDGAGGGILSLTKLGAGILKLAGVNTYTGATTISAGTLQTGVANALSTGTDVNVVAGATFDLNSTNQSIGSLAGAVGSFVTLGTAVLTTGNNSAANTTFSGVISGPNGTSGLTKVGTGSFTLDGAVANTYAGPTRVNDGVLILNKTAGVNATGTGGGGLFIGDVAGAVGSAIVRLGAADQIADATEVTLAADGRFDLNNNNETVASISGTGGLITLGSATLTTGDVANTTFAGNIQGAGGVTKQGAGTWTLSGNNTYLGATAVNAGTLLAGSTTALAGTSAFTVGANSILDLGGNNNSVGSLAGAGPNSFVQTTGASATLTTGADNTSTGYGGVLRDVGAARLSLTKVGTGTQTLTGANTYSGTTTVAGGSLFAGAVNTLSANSAVVVNAGSLDLGAFNNTILSLAGSGGSVTSAGAATLTFGDANSLTYSGNITNFLSLVKNGAGIQTLAGVNTYTGTTTINAGGIKAGSATALGTGSNFNLNSNTVTLDLAGFSNTIGSLTGLAGSIVQNSTGVPATLTTNAAAASTFAGNLVNGGGAPLAFTKTGAGVLTLSGNNTYSGPTTVLAGGLTAGSLTAFSATSALINQAGGTVSLNGFNNTVLSLSDGGTAGGTVNNNAGGNAVLTFGDATNTRFNGLIVNGAAGTLGLTKQGAGATTLGGANTYTGPTTIIAGRLIGGNATSFGTNSAVDLTTAGATLDIGGTSVAIGSLTGVAGTIVTDSVTNATLTTGGLNQNTTFAGNIIDGPGAILSLTKVGTGIQTLSGNNTYTGATTINGGTLLAGSTTALSAGSAFQVNAGGLLDLGGFNNTVLSLSGVVGGSIRNSGLPNAVLQFGDGNNNTFAGTIVSGPIGSGSLGLTKVGGGTQILSGANTYTGPTQVNAGRLQAGVASVAGVSGAFGFNSAVTLANAGTTLDLTTFNNTIGSLNGAVGTVVQGNAAVLTTGALNTADTFAGVVQDGGGVFGLTKVGAGTMTLTNINTYTGATTVNGGKLLAGSTQAFGVNSAVTVNNGGNLDLGGFNNTVGSLSGTAVGVVQNSAAAAILTTGGGGGSGNFSGNIVNGTAPLSLTKIGAGTQTLSGINTYTGPTTVNTGILQAGSLTGLSATSAFLVNTGGTLSLNGFNNTILSLTDNGIPGGTVNNGAAGNAVLTFGDANNLTFHGVIANGAAGTLGLTKNGAGKQILTGISTYTGPTIVNAGTLQVEGSIASALVNVKSGATLAGFGTVGGAGSTTTIEAGGRLAPGASPGTITIGGNLILDSLSFSDYELGTPGVVTPVAPFTNDLTIVNGNLTLDGTLTVTNAGGFGPGAYRLFNYAGALTNNTLNVNPVPGGFTTYVTTNIANQVNLIVLAGVGAGAQYWDGPNLVGNGIVDGGASTWNNLTTNWTDAVGAVNSGWQNGSAVFQGTAGVVTLGDDINFQALRFDTTGYSIVPGAGPFTLLANGAVTITTANVTATIDAVIANDLQLGADSITTNGGGTLVLTGLNTYTGATTINDGVVAVTTFANGGAASGVGASGNAATNLVLNGGTLRYTGGVASSSDRLFSVGTNGGKLDASGVGAVNFTNIGAMGFNSQAGARTLELTGTSVAANTLATAIGDNGAGVTTLVKTGTGTWNLAGTNTYTGTTTVNAGTLQAGSLTGLSATSAFLVNTGGTLSLNGFNNTILSLTDNGIPGGTVNNGAAGNAVLTFGDANNLTFHGVIANGAAGTLGLTKNGAGKQILTGINTYTGPTTIKTGTLQVDGSIASLAVNVQNGATLAGFGTVGGAASTVTIENGGILAPGASPGTITIGGNLVLNTGSLSNYELGTPGVVTVLAPFINDLTVVNGNLTLDGTLNVADAGGFGPGAYRLFNYVGALTNNTLNVNAVPGGFTTYVTTNIANQVNLIVLANPGAGAQFWDGPNLVANGIVDGGTSTWSNGANSNWTNSSGSANSNWNNGIGVFQGTAGTVTLADDINFQGLVFNTTGYVINAGVGLFTLLANGAVTITTANVSATINAVIANDNVAGADSITTNGGGTLVLAGLNTYTGSTTINDGIVSVSTLASGSAASGIGASGNAATNLVLNGGTLQYTGAAVSTDRLFSVGTNGGKLDASGAGAVNFNNVGAMGFNGQGGARTLELTGTNVGANTLATAIGNNGGATSLVKNGAGTWVLSGINNYSGATTINGGILRAGSVTGLSNTSAFLVNGGGTLDVNGLVSTILSLSDNGVGPGFGTVTNNGAVATVLTFGDANNLTFRGNIVNGTSALGITKVGTGIEILSGNNTYTGPTTINAGTLQAGSTTAFGVNSLVAVNLGGTLDLGGFSNSVGALTSTVPGGTVRNTGALAATLTITGTGLPQTFAGNIVNTTGAGALSLTKNGAGTQILSGVNTYNGVTTIGGGVLMAGSTTAFGTNSQVNITVAGAGTGLDLGGFNNSIGSLQGIAGSIVTTTNGPAVLTTGGNGVNATFAGNLINGVTAPGFDVLSLTKVGPGIQTLSGVNTYTGATNVNGGILQAGSATAFSATSAFFVNTAGILDLNGFNNTILSLTDTGAPGGTIQNGVAANVVLTFGDANNLTFRGNIIAGPGAGTLGITKNGAGQQTLSGVNNYAGATTINNGALVAGSTTAFSGASAYNLTAAGTTLDLATFNNSIFSLTGVAGSIVKDTGGVGATLTITNGGGANFAGNMIDNGPLALHKSGPGTQILSGINTYSGDTIIDSGVLQAGSTTAFSPNSDFFVNTGGTLSLAGFNNTILTLSDNGAPGGIVQNGAVGNAVLTFGDANNLTFNGLVQNGGAGTLGLTKSGTGAQTMNGLNTYTGPTTVNAGRLIAGSTSAYGVNSAVTVGNGGTLDLGGFQNTIGSLAGIPGSTVQNSTGVAATLTTGTLGTSTLFAGNLVNGAGAPLALTKVGAGTMTVSGLNTYTGATNVNAGVLQAGSITAFSAGSAHAVNTGSTLALNGFNNTILSLTDSGAPGGTVQNGGVADAILTFGDANNLTFRGLIQNGGAGTLGITKNGTGAQTHSGVNTYTGPTTINNGRLIGGSTSAFGVNSAVNITAAAGALDLGSFNNTIGSLTGVVGSTVTDSVANATLTTGTLNQNTTFAGNIINGPGAVLSFVKTGTGIQTLSGNNTYSGGTTINAGTILAGSTTALSATSAYNLTVAGAILDLGGFSNTIGSLAGVAGTTVQTVAGPATLTTGGDNTSTTYAGLITNSLGNALSLVKNGNGTFTITGANTYTGTTTHNSGGLLINNNTALGAGNLVINNAGAGTTFGSGVAGVTFANATQINGDFSVNPTGTLTASGPVTLNGTRTITGTNANTFNFGGPIGELAGGTGVVFTSVPASVFQYSGLAANTYTGLTTVQGNATLQLNKTAGIDAIGTGGLTVQNTATVTSLADQQINDGATVLLNNTATFNLNGRKETITTLNTDAGTTTVVRLDGGGVGGTLTVNNGTVNGQIIDNGSGGNLVKNGAAGDALTLTRANAYNGRTTLNSGILNINNDTALGTSTLRINGGLVGNTDLLTVSHTFANSVVVQGSFEVNGPQQLISSGPVSLAVANTTINTLAGGLDFNGVISEVNPVSNLTFTGATSTTFGGAGSNTYSGLTSVDGGTLTLAKTGGATAVAGHLNIANGATVKFGGPAASNQQIAGTSNVDVRGTFNLNGHNQAINTLTGDGSVLLGNAALTAGQLTVNGGVFSGDISDNGPSGQLVKTSGSILVLAGSNSLTGPTLVQQGTLVLNGSVGGNVIVFNPALLAGTGLVRGNLTNIGTVSPGNSPGTLVVHGSYNQTASGSLHIEVGGLAGNEHDLLAVGGPASLNGTVRLVALNNFVLKRGDKVVFLTGNQVSGKFSNEDIEIATNSKFLKADIQYETNTVALVAEQLKFSKVLKGLTPNQKAVAKALDGALNDKRLDEVIGFLNADAFGNVPYDLDLIAAEELQSLYTIGISQAHVQSANLERRMGDIRAGFGGFSASGYSVSGGAPEYSGAFNPRADGLTGPSGKMGKEIRPPTQDANLGVFITGVGEFTHVGSTNNASGFDLATGGFTLGVDYRIGENFAIGINAGYSRSSADLFGNGRVNVDGAKIGMYATYFTGGFYADIAAQGGYNNYDTKRTALEGTARGGTTGGEFSAMFKTGYDFKTGGLTFGPTAGLQYTHVGFRGFTETGSLLPLTYAKQSADSLTSRLGLKASYDWQIGGAIVRPEVQAAWQHEFEDTAYAINSRFANGAGNSFTVHGAETGRESLLLGAGVAVLWNERTSTYVYYDGEVGRTNYDSHNVSGGMRMSF